jgi:cellulose synthase operon protein YhjQ
MNILSVVSMKGGVGKTSVTANLATALARRLGPGRVFIIDLDPQNALQWHFGFVDYEQKGICNQSAIGGAWNDIALSSATGVTLFPYGAVDEHERLAFEQLLKEQPDWLKIKACGSQFKRDAIVLIDTPPGVSPYLPQVIGCSDVSLVVLLADGASYATIPAMETAFEELIPMNPYLRTSYLLNQFDQDDTLGKDIQTLLQRHLGERLLLPTIHVDEGVKEALAFQQPVLVYDPHGQACQDFADLATWALGELVE